MVCNSFFCDEYIDIFIYLRETFVVFQDFLLVCDIAFFVFKELLHIFDPTDWENETGWKTAPSIWTHQLADIIILLIYLSMGFSGTPKDMGPPYGKRDPYYSHTTPTRIPKDMGMVWEAYHKGVPLLGVPGITLKFIFFQWSTTRTFL